MWKTTLVSNTVLRCFDYYYIVYSSTVFTVEYEEPKYEYASTRDLNELLKKE
ncbi:hypothetical protein BD31_I0581 [Candidatus Nitrosopumilus salaria BD31]|uniref:Uncharacterized protein n=1 Tax=Candidatus Nitrosopumilus salarius BD31 TaxID=859350 RepID=I3D2X4_9ARCH|nr:hypothetical protein BD31_I0581 [Candidatus Nitrosopumilus salaria BD31]